MLDFIIQATQQVPGSSLEKELPAWVQHLLTFIDTPAPYSPFSEYLLILLILWLFARRKAVKKDFSAEAQTVLDAKYEKGELDTATYEKYRQELSMRVKKGS